MDRIIGFITGMLMVWAIYTVGAIFICIIAWEFVEVIKFMYSGVLVRVIFVVSLMVGFPMASGYK